MPFAAYPLHPVACARLIGDLAVFMVETSGYAVAGSLGEAGLKANWGRPPGVVGDLALGGGRDGDRHHYLGRTERQRGLAFLSGVGLAVLVVLLLGKS